MRFDFKLEDRSLLDRRPGDGGCIVNLLIYLGFTFKLTVKFVDRSFVRTIPTIAYLNCKYSTNSKTVDPVG